MFVTVGGNREITLYFLGIYQHLFFELVTVGAAMVWLGKFKLIHTNPIVLSLKKWKMWKKIFKMLYYLLEATTFLIAITIIFLCK